MDRHLLPYLVMMSRFALLAGLALWIGSAVAMMVATPVLFRTLERAQAGEIAGAMLRRIDFLLLACIVIVSGSLGFRIIRDGTAPPATLLVPVAGMVASRLIAAFAVAPGIRALRLRMKDTQAPATAAERGAFTRLHGAAMAMMTLEIILGVYALFAIS